MPVIRDLRAAVESTTELAEQARLEASQQVPYRTVLIIEFGETGDEWLDVVFPHNPESYDTEYQSRWRARQAPGVPRDLSDFEGHDPTTRSFVWLGQTESPGSFEADVLLPLEALMEAIEDNTQEPPRVQLIQGVNSMRGHASSLVIRRIRTDSSGRATVAEISLTIVQNDDF